MIFALISARQTAASSLPDSTATDSTTKSSSVKDTTAKKVPVKVIYQWPADSSETVCREPLESAVDCWRHSTRWAGQEIGFPGTRSRTLSLSSFEPAGVQSFFQPTLSLSPYGTGGFIPFDRVDEREGITEVWSPVLPVDTPVTSLHWTRGAFYMNQFTLNLRRMVGKRAYLGFQMHSDKSESKFYEYSFNVHQPYLSGWGIPPLRRDSSALVINDTSHSVHASELRPRLGFWLDNHTVVEIFSDWLDNTSSLTNPGNRNASDSAQLLYPASFSAWTLGAVAARATAAHQMRLSLTHSEWERDLAPHGDSAARYVENATGTRERIEALWSPLSLPGKLSFDANAEMDSHEYGKGNTEALAIHSRPTWNMIGLQLEGNATRRQRPGDKLEWLGGADGDLKTDLPYGFSATAGAGWKKEGAGDDTLFRLQPAMGLYPNLNLKPRTDLHLQAGGEWETHWPVDFGLGASWERHAYGDNWLPRILPENNICLHTDSTRFPTEREPLCPDTGPRTGRMPDSLALALVNYHEELRDLVHLSMLLRLGHWELSLLHTYLIGNSVKDPRLGFTEKNTLLPNRIYKGRLLWRRTLLDRKLGVQTQWDWEWFAARSAWAADLDGASRPVKLDEYLALDFTARMEIKTFMLYFRAMNLWHDRYATEAGVHPPGVNFRFGIDWRLFN